MGTGKPMMKVILLCVFWAVTDCLKLKDGAYEDLVIQVGEDVPAERCRDALSNLEATLTESSQYLFSALDGRAYLRSITILLPSGWQDGCAPSQIRSASGESADVTLVPRGQTIWTQQSGGCGQPGDHVFLNYNSLLDDDTQMLSRLLVKEFAKYRYGVFDEQGYNGDAVYPLCYRQEDEAKVTGCSDLPIRDDGICSEENGNGRYNVSLLIDPKARTSIMFGAAAPSVSMFCDEGNHDRYAPTKHNFMCDRRSTLDVILQHPDFLTSPSLAQHNAQLTNTTPIISYARHTLTRYVLVIEDTQEMLMRESWTYLRNAVRKWAVYDLPKNTEVALIMMNESAASVLLNPTLLTNHTSRDVVASNVPYTPGDSRAAACLHCALRDAITMLEETATSRGPASSVVLIIAPGMDHNVDKAMEQATRAANIGIKVATINYPGVLRQQPLDNLAAETSGPSYTVYERKHNIDTSLLTTYFQLTNVMYDIATNFYQGGALRMPTEIHRRELTDDGRNSVTGSFVLNEKMGEPARFSLFTHNVESPLIKAVTLWSPSQVAYTRRSDSLLGVKIITLAAPISEPGTWTYRIERWSGNPQPHYVQVMATPKALDVVRARFWYRRRAGALILYVEVKKDLLPVLGATVQVQVTKPESNGTIAYKDKFELLDTGSGDPDITKGDGIYTRYFSANYVGPGMYTFEVTVTDNGNTAYCSQNGPSAEPCCGSFTPTSKVEPLSPFERMLTPLTIQITSEDMLTKQPPAGGRVGDLRAQVFAQDKRVRLTWTSPDMRGSNAARYEVRYARSVQDIADRFETSAMVWDQGQPLPLAAGSEIPFTLNFTTPEASTMLGIPLYFAIKAFPALSHDSQAGHTSNWVRVLVPKPPPPPPTVPPTYSTQDYTAWPFPNQGSVTVDPSPGVAHSSDLGIQLILPIVIGAILLLLLVVVYCYFCVVKKKERQAAKKSVSNSDAKIQSAITILPGSPGHNPTPPPQPENHEHAYTNDLHNVGVPIGYQFEDEPKKRYSLVQQQEQQLIEELKQQQQQQQYISHGYAPTPNGMNVSIISNQAGTLQRGGRTLSPYESWSASQLLHEHERRHSPMDEMLQSQPPQTQPPMDHYNVMVPPPVPPLPSYNGYPVNYNIYGVHPSQQQQIQCNTNNMYHQPPPPFNVSLQGSMSSVNSAEKKKRNVTMV